MKKVIMLLFAVMVLAGCSNKTNAMTLEQAQELALKEVDGEVVKAKEDIDDGVKYYDFTIITDSEKYEIEIDGDSGKVIKKEKDVDYQPATTDSNSGTGESNAEISIEDAKKIAIDKVGGGDIVKTELDYENGISKYEIEIRKDNKEYDLEINRETGEIIKYKEDVD